MNCVAPGHTVGSKVRPLPVVDVAGSERLLQVVLESLRRSPSITMPRGKFAKQDDLWKAMIFQSGNMTRHRSCYFKIMASILETSACSRTSTLVIKSLQWMLRMVRRQRWWKRSRDGEGFLQVNVERDLATLVLMQLAHHL